MSYFNKFPRLAYPTGDKERIIKNVFIRANVSQQIKNNGSLYFEYDVTDGDTPEIVAHKVYGDVGLHWLVMMMNDVQNLYCDWVKSGEEFDRFVTDKYGSGNEYATHHWEDQLGNVVAPPSKETGNGYVIFQGYTEPTQDAEPQNNVVYTTQFPDIIPNTVIEAVSLPSATRIESIEQDDFDPTRLKITLDKDWIQQGTTTFYVQDVLTASPVSNYDYEFRLNESKRRIKLLNVEFVSIAKRDLENLIEGA